MASGYAMTCIRLVYFCARAPPRDQPADGAFTAPLRDQRVGDLELFNRLEAWLTSVDTWLTALDIAICLVDLSFIAIFLLLRRRDRVEEKARAAPFASRFQRRRPRDAPTPRHPAAVSLARRSAS
jgi:hypothetical protein